MRLPRNRCNKAESLREEDSSSEQTMLPVFKKYCHENDAKNAKGKQTPLCIAFVLVIGALLAFCLVSNGQVNEVNPSSFEVSQCTHQTLKSIDVVFSPEIRRREAKCPDASWLDDHYNHKHLVRLHERPEPLEDANFPSNKKDNFVGVCVGCNKGYDSVNFMRMGSANSQFDELTWKDALEEFSPTAGACGQEGAGQFQIPFIDGDGPPNGRFTNAYVVENAKMHCIEPLRANIDMVSKSMQKLGWDKQGFTLTHAAIAENDGSIKFPKAMPGVENLGMFSCEESGADCEDVIAYSLDSYATQFIGEDTPINILSIDVEGHDFEVLRGATRTLLRTEYLEFEFHQVGPWANYSLLDAVEMLDEQGFTCYWEGKRRLYRITKCWSEQYNEHFWSNVVCVNRTNIDLATRMEAVFQTELLLHK